MKIVKNKKAFTLVELLAVIVILGILLTLIIPNVTKYINTAKKEAYVASVLSIAKAIESEKIPTIIKKKNSSEIYYFDDVNVRGSTQKSPYANFIKNRSFVLIDCDDNKCSTYVQAIDESGVGIVLKNKEEITSKDVINIEAVDASCFCAPYIQKVKDSSNSGNTTKYHTFYNKNQKDVIVAVVRGVGDINDDGKINIVDLTQLQKYSGGLIELSPKALKRADVNLDGTVNIADQTAFQKYLGGILPYLPIKTGDYNCDGVINSLDPTNYCYPTN